jgi:predicted CXXCH cytochrome family protein
MKKLLSAVVIGLLLVAVLATTAMADNGPHGGFTATTEKCAGCHRAHSAKSNDGFLLNATDVYALCMTCHKGGAGAYTDVANGVYFNGAVTGLAAPYGAQGDKGAVLFGGAFEFSPAPHTWNGKDGYDTAGTLLGTAAAITSRHGVKGLDAGTGTVWGSNDVNVAADVWTAPATATASDNTLTCTSCHDPHGRAGRSKASTFDPAETNAAMNADWAQSTADWNAYVVEGGVLTGQPMASYRLLRFEPEGSNGFEVTGTSLNWWKLGNTQGTDGITVRDTYSQYWYTPNTDYTKDPNVQFYRTRYDGTTGEWTAWSSYISQYGDAAGRSYVYNRPAVTTTTVDTTATGTNTAATAPTSGLFTCKNAGALPPLPTYAGPGVDGIQGNADDTFKWQTYACGAATGTTFNNNSNGANGASARAIGRGQLGFWCATCHDKYIAGSLNSNNTANTPGGANNNSRTSASGSNTPDLATAPYQYRHNSANTTPCVDCHYAHGSAAVMTVTNNTYASASLTTGGILLKTDERSICLKCHGHDVNFSYVP